MAKIVILGLDGFSPTFIKKWSDDLPNLTKIQKEGIWGDIKSAIPLTLPQVWVTTQCGQDPGVHGIWDFTFRDDFSYSENKVIDCEIMNRTNPLYMLLPRRAQKVAIINVPFTWPPPKIPGGYAIFGSIASKEKSILTYPNDLKEEISKLVQDEILEAELEPETSGEHLLKNTYNMDSQSFTLTKYFINDKNCDYVMTTLRGADHMLDLFYKHFGPKSRYHTPDFSYEKTLHSYYIWVDKKIGELRENFNKDVILFICNCFGVQRLEGRINLNEWLIREGYMVLQEYPRELTPFNNLKVNWSKTKCWSPGYAGKLYLNLKGRESEGIVDSQNYDELIDELIAKIQQDIPNELGKNIDIQTWKRADIYFGPYAKYGPDLFVNFDKGCLGTSELVGHNQKAIYSHNIAPYNSNTAHSLYGYFSISGPGIPAEGECKEVSLLNIAPTVLNILKLSIPKRMKGSSILSLIKKEEAKKAEKTERVHSRLEALGY